MFKKSLKLFVVGSALFCGLYLSSCSNDMTNSINSSSQTENDVTFADANPRMLGALKDPASVTSAKLAKIAYSTTIPAAIDLSGSMPPIGNQGSQGSCVGWAVAYAAKSIVEQKEWGWSPSLTQNQFSPAWIYNQIKISSDCLRGSYFSDALNLLQSSGCDNLMYFPYTSTCSTLPDQASKNRALQFKISDWGYINPDVTAIKSLLASGQPAIIGFAVYPDYDNLNSTNSVYDNLSGTKRGYHANCIVGYDDSKNAFKIVNSWNTTWGINGYGWLSYSIITDSRLELSTYYLVDIIHNTYDHGIYKWNGNNWDKSTSSNSEGVCIAANQIGIPWMINKIGEIYRKADATLSSSWVKLSGLATDIDIGDNDDLWVIGNQYVSNTDDYQIYKWNNLTSVWQQASGGAVKIAVSPTGIPWVVNSKGIIYRKRDGSLTSGWTQISGSATDIGIGADGSVWIISATAIPGTNDWRIYKWNGSGWSDGSGGGIRIAVDQSGVPWVINSKGEIYKKEDATLWSSWILCPGLGTDIGIGQNGTVWITGTDIF